VSLRGEGQKREEGGKKAQCRGRTECLGGVGWWKSEASRLERWQKKENYRGLKECAAKRNVPILFLPILCTPGADGRSRDGNTVRQQEGPENKNVGGAGPSNLDLFSVYGPATRGEGEGGL